MTSSQKLQNAFSRNRAEEFGLDVWNDFVIPPFYDRLDIKTARKPRVIIGGRGCGKTMLLRYLSHQTIFSPLRNEIPKDAVEHIGLYWRADTHFMNLMSGRNIPEDIWASAFNHMVAVVLGIELLGSLKSIGESRSDALTMDDVARLDFSKLNAFDKTLSATFEGLYGDLEKKLWEFETWVNNVRSEATPHFLIGKNFLSALLKEILRQAPGMTEANYFVYVDEYENLTVQQKKIVNTWLKHSQAPLIFNLAIKRNGMNITDTIGSESLADIHDYRINDLELEMDSHFPVFAAEILLLKMALETTAMTEDLAILRDPEGLQARRDQEYEASVLGKARQYFPSISNSEMAAQALADNAILKKLKERVDKALVAKHSRLKSDKFVRLEFPEASIVVPALLHRPSLPPEDILAELDKLTAGKPNSFTGSKAWIHNNFIGTYLQLFEPYSRACPFYAGFQTFCHLSHGNLRFFLELCHKSISLLEDSEIVVPIELQAEAARQASAAFLKEVRAYGSHGLQLHMFVMRLGSLFAIAHHRPSQSEPEQTHFSIGMGRAALTAEDHQFLSEAVKWSVLYEEMETKRKSESDPEGIEYVLAPIYAPYFHISYRKKRRISLSTDECITLMRGSYDQVKAMLNDYSKKWKIGLSSNPTLFSHLEEP